MVYVPGFSPSLQGGPAQMQMPLGPVPMASTPAAAPPPPMHVTRADMINGLNAPMSGFTTAPNYNPQIDGIGMNQLGFDYLPGASGGGISEADLEGFAPRQTQAEIDAAFANVYNTPHLPFAGMMLDGQAGAFFRNSQSQRAALDGAGGNSGFVSLDPNGQYRLVDRATGQVLATGSGADGLRAVHEASQRLTSDQRGRANWAVEQMLPGAEGWTRAAEDRPDPSTIGKIADFALPAIGAALMPLTGGMSGALAAGLGAAGGSALSSVAQGRGLKDTLLRAGISGVAAGGLSAAGNALGGAASGAGGALPGAALGAGTVAQTGLGMALPGIIVSGAGGALGGAAGGTIGGALGGVLGSTTSGAGAGAAGAQQPPMQQEQPGGIIVTGQPNPGVPNFGVAPPLPLPTPGGGNEIVVTGNKNQQPDLGGPAVLPPFGSVPTNAGGTAGGTQEAQTPEREDNWSLDEIINYLRAAGLLTGVLGSAFEGGGRGNQGTIPGGLFSGLNPVFGGGLPAPTMPGASNNFSQRPVDVDWKRYGYGPGQSFFNYVPQGAPNNSTAYTGYAEGGSVAGGMPMGGDSFAVQGAGTGRSDEIPALLSDGEYVFDAETVALLGDGSTDAGAEKLDQFRVNIRKHKGQQLAKGNFSPDAKQPHNYLHGGRV